jgi:hypothetical protein
MTWGEIRVGYYVAIVVLLWLFNGTPSAIFLGLLIGLWIERDFKRYVFSRFDVVGDDGAVMKAVSTAKATAKERSRANDAADSKPAAKKTTTKPKAATKPKPKPAVDDLDD